MATATIEIWRFDPTRDAEPRPQRFEVPAEDGATVLQALMHVYEELDSSLAFRCGCRYQYCGLCALEVDGHAVLSCITPLKDGQVLKPLRHLPVARDLLVDRAWVFERMRSLELYIPEPPVVEMPEQFFEPEEHKHLMRCTECLACLASCPHYDSGDDSFGGTYTFVKLAQLHFDPRDHIDRVGQARALGIERCVTCRSCKCPVGVLAWKYATSVLLEGTIKASRLEQSSSA